MLDDDLEPGQRGFGAQAVLAAHEDLQAALDGVAAVLAVVGVQAGHGEQGGVVLAGDAVGVDEQRCAARRGAGERDDGHAVLL